MNSSQNVPVNLAVVAGASAINWALCVQLCAVASVRCNTCLHLIFLLSQAVKVLGFIDQKQVHVAKIWLLQVNGSHLGYHLAFRMLCYNHTENRGL